MQIKQGATQIRYNSESDYSAAWGFIKRKGGGGGGGGGGVGIFQIHFIPPPPPPRY